jgi:Uncharacterised nucleotidyltransferase
VITPLAPTAEQRLLLTAALGSEDEARAAFGQWRERQDVDDLDGASKRVVPLLAARLDELGAEDLSGRLGSVLRATWLRTHALFRNVAPIVAALRDADVPVMLGKGAAVLAHTGWRIAERPMDDVDVIVPLGRAVDAVRIVRAGGFDCPLLPPDAAATPIYGQTHALGFWDGAGASIDVHWHVLHGSLHPSADEAFWAAAVATEFEGTPCLALSREDTFLQVVAHGQEMTVFHPLRWAADAVLLLRSGPGFDWDRVAREARRHRLAGEIGAALDALARLDPTLVPRRAQRALGTPMAERVLRPRARTRGEAFWEGPLAPTRSERVAEDAREYVRRTVAPGARIRPAHAAAGLAETLALRSPRDLARHAAWVASGRRRFAPRDEAPAGAPPVRLPAALQFTVGSDGTAYLGAGWWAPDDHGTWSRGREATLVVPLAQAPRRPVHLRFTVVPYLAETRPHLEVDVHAGGRLAARWGFSAVGPVEEGRDVLLSSSSDAIALRFVIRSPISPQTARADADPRPLGLALRAVAMAEAAG